MERRGIGHLVPILGGRRLAEVVPLVGGACPSGYCQVDMAVHLVGPVPTPHGAQAVGRHPKDVAQPVVPPRPHSRQQVVRRRGGFLLIQPPATGVTNA